MKAWIIRLVTTYLLKNWRTTVVGAIGFVVTQFPQTKTWLETQGYSIDALQGLILLIIAFFAKDGSVTGVPKLEPVGDPTPTNAGPYAGG